MDASKIDNVSCGINSNFQPLTQSETEDTRNRWSGGKPYFFFVGSMHPRKNIKRLIEGYNLFRKNNASDTRLVLAGAILWSKSDIEESYITSEYKDDIVFTGRLSDDELRLALGAALALSFVPIFEGFGLPIVEAMQSGVPVISSNVTSMPEVAGDAALYVDPFKIDEIANAMQKLSSDEQLRLHLIEKGHQQKLKFTWERTAELLWTSIEKC